MSSYSALKKRANTYGSKDLSQREIGSKKVSYRTM
jgi:hypothetical protein